MPQLLNTRLNTSDYWILFGYYLISSGLAYQDYREMEFSNGQACVFITITTIIELITIFIFYKHLFPRHILKGKILTFFVLGIMTLILLSLVENIGYHLTMGRDLVDFEHSPRNILDMFGQLGFDIGLPFGLLLAKKFYEGQAALSQAQQAQRENELKLLRSQVNPHFLFNNLNTLDALIATNPDRARIFVSRLSSIYRYLIRTKDAEVMPLDEELRLAEDYIYLIETRFGDDYQVRIEHHSSTQDKYLPTGALQTLVENIIKHNRKMDGQPVLARITVEEDQVVVSNTISKILSKVESTGTGLQNLRDRYILLGNDNLQIQESEKEYTVLLPILKLID